jgi:serine/threonine-protein kinase
VYSLALVMAAAAVGHDLQMGGTLVDAVDRRRKGPDLSEVPERLRPVLSAMLRPDPAERLRSMDDVLAMLDAARAPARAAAEPVPEPAAKIPRAAIFGGAAVALLLIVGLIFWLSSGSEKGAPPTPSPQAAAQPGQAVAPQQPNVIAAADPIQAARSTINSIIPSIECSWLTVGQVSGDAHELNVVMGGVAGDPSSAQSEVISALRRGGFAQANVDFSAIAPIQPGGCSVLDAYRQIPRIDQQLLKTPQLVWHRDTIAKAGDYAGQHVAKTIVTLSIDPQADFTLVGIEPSGLFSTLFSSRAELEKGVAASLADFRAGNTAETNPTKLAPGEYQFKADINHDGWSGLALIVGQGPFPPAIVSPPLGARNVDWQNRFATYAAQHGWKADMLWFKVDGQGGD